MNAIEIGILSLIYTGPGPGLLTVVEDMRPTTQSETEAEAKYLLRFLELEEEALGRDHPRLACDTLHVARVVAGWDHLTTVDPDATLLRASQLTGRCAADALDAYFANAKK